MVENEWIMHDIPVDVLPLVNALDVLVQRHPPDRREVALIAAKLLDIFVSLLLGALSCARIVA